MMSEIKRIEEIRIARNVLLTIGTKLAEDWVQDPTINMPEDTNEYKQQEQVILELLEKDIN